VRCGLHSQKNRVSSGAAAAARTTRCFVCLLATRHTTQHNKHQQQEQATAYLNGLKQSPEGWRFCIDRFSATQHAEVKFWCLQTLHEVVRAYYTQLDEPSQSAIKAALVTWLQRDCAVEATSGGGVDSSSAGANAGGASAGEPPPLQPVPPYLRNKLAQALVSVVQLEYPHRWPSFFRDLVAAAHSGPGLADMFCRVMAAVDEDIISLDIPR
jgi:exportin-T